MFLGQFFKATPNFDILETLAVILRDQVYFENYMAMDKVRELIMTMLFCKYTWSLRMADNVSKIVKFGFALKNWPKNMYHMYILKYDQLPDLIHDHVILEVHLVPQDGLESH